MNFNEYIKDKRVCFVGPSSLMIDKNYGELIDSYDVIVRTNNSVNFIEDANFAKDYGSRIDVLYTNNQFYREMSPLPIEQYKNKGVKFLRMKTCKQDDFKNFNKVINTRIITNIIKNVNLNNPSATMGVYAFCDILKYEPKELYITGVSFFSNKKKEFEHDNYNEYYKGYLPDKIRIQGNLINKNKKEDGHNFLGNAHFIYNLWKKNKNMTFPDFIKDILIGIIEGKVQQK